MNKNTISMVDKVLKTFRESCLSVSNREYLEGLCNDCLGFLRVLHITKQITTELFDEAHNDIIGLYCDAVERIAREKARAELESVVVEIDDEIFYEVSDYLSTFETNFSVQDNMVEIYNVSQEYRFMELNYSASGDYVLFDRDNECTIHFGHEDGVIREIVDFLYGRYV